MSWNYFLSRLLLFAVGPSCRGDVDLEEMAFHSLIMGQCLLLLFSDVLLTTLDTCLTLFWSPGWRSVDLWMLISLWHEPQRLRTLKKYIIIFLNSDLGGGCAWSGARALNHDFFFLNAYCCSPVLTAQGSFWCFSSRSGLPYLKHCTPICRTLLVDGHPLVGVPCCDMDTYHILLLWTPLFNPVFSLLEYEC